MDSLSQLSLNGVFAVAVGLYLLASCGYALVARGWKPSRLRWPLLLLCAAMGFHIWVIGGQCVGGSHPFSSLGLFLNTGGLVVVLGYVMLSAGRRPMRELGSLVALVGLGAVVAGFASDPSVRDAGHYTSTIVRWHLVLAMLGVAAFALAAGVAFMYLLLERRLRSKRLDAGMEGLSVRGLDLLHSRLVAAVAPIFAASVLCGVLAATDGGGIAMISERIFEIAAAGVAFGAVLINVIGRYWTGLRGHRAAWLTIAGFTFVVLIIISYGVRS